MNIIMTNGVYVDVAEIHGRPVREWSRLQLLEILNTESFITISYYENLEKQKKTALLQISQIVSIKEPPAYKNTNRFA